MCSHCCSCLNFWVTRNCWKFSLAGWYGIKNGGYILYSPICDGPISENQFNNSDYFTIGQKSLPLLKFISLALLYNQSDSCRGFRLMRFFCIVLNSFISSLFSIISYTALHFATILILTYITDLRYFTSIEHFTGILIIWCSFYDVLLPFLTNPAHTYF